MEPGSAAHAMSDGAPGAAPAGYRAGFAALVGRPNAGKSTLLNALLGQKLSIVSSKPQTTRHRIAGILSEPGFQAVLIDTPGLIDPKYLLQDLMMKNVRTALGDADVVVLIVDASVPQAAQSPEPALQQSGAPVIVALNKADAAGPDRLRDAAAHWRGMPNPPEALVEISALQRTGLDALKAEIVSRLPEHPAFYPEDSVSDRHERFFVAEIIREKVFECYREEIPYSTSVRILSFEERKGRKDRIEAEICVERDSQKGILIGGRGAALKKVGKLSRRDIEEFLGRPVYLELRVKVRDRWRDDSAWLGRLGYAE